MFNDILLNQDFSSLINMREKAVEFREKTEKKLINKMFRSKQYSSRRYKVERD